MKRRPFIMHVLKINLIKFRAQQDQRENIILKFFKLKVSLLFRYLKEKKWPIYLPT